MITFTFLEDYKHINQDGFPPSFLSSLSCSGRDGDSSAGVGQSSSFSSCRCENTDAVVLSLSKQTKKIKALNTHPYNLSRHSLPMIRHLRKWASLRHYALSSSMARAEWHACDTRPQVSVSTLPLISDQNVKHGLDQDSGYSLTKTMRVIVNFTWH